MKNLDEKYELLEHIDDAAANAETLYVLPADSVAPALGDEMLSSGAESERRGADTPLAMKPRLLLPASGPLASATTSSTEPAARSSGSEGTTNDTVVTCDGWLSAQSGTFARSMTE